MNLKYPKGSIVVITAFGRNMVGSVVDRSISKKEIVHTIESESGKIYEDVSVNSADSGIYINGLLTSVFNKSKDDGDNSDSI